MRLLFLYCALPSFPHLPRQSTHMVLIACAPADMKGPSICAHPQFTHYFLLPLYCDREDECSGGSLQVGETTVGSVLSTFLWGWGLNSGHQACAAVPLPAEPSASALLPTTPQVDLRPWSSVSAGLHYCLGKADKKPTHAEAGSLPSMHR